MILSPPPRRPSRVAAGALLLILHLAAIELFVHLRTPRAGSDERLLTLVPIAPPAAPRTPVATESAAAPVRAPRPLVAPLPPLDVAPPTTRDGVTPIGTLAAPGSTAETAGAAASTAGPAKLDLAIPKDFYAHPPPLTPAQEAMQDPRSNRLVLTKQEQMDVDFGVVECIAWQREPNGSIYRGPGHWQRVQGINANPFHAHKPGTEDRSLECVK